MIIFTYFLGPTNTLGSRVRATNKAGNMATLPWDHSKNVDQNHDAALRAYVEKHCPERKGEKYMRGYAPQGEFAYTPVNDWNEVVA